MKQTWYIPSCEAHGPWTVVEVPDIAVGSVKPDVINAHRKIKQILCIYQMISHCIGCLEEHRGSRAVKLAALATVKIDSAAAATEKNFIVAE